MGKGAGGTANRPIGRLLGACPSGRSAKRVRRAAGNNPVEAPEGSFETYHGFPHGMPTTQADTINADLLAFVQS